MDLLLANTCSHCRQTDISLIISACMTELLTGLGRNADNWSSLFDNLCDVRAIYAGVHPETFMSISLNAIDYGNLESLSPHRILSVYYVYEYLHTPGQKKDFDEQLEDNDSIAVRVMRSLTLPSGYIQAFLTCALSGGAKILRFHGACRPISIRFQ